MSKKTKYKELKIESIGFEGRSIARNEGLVYFVKNGIPGDTIKAKIKKKRKSYTEAEIEEVLEFSDERTEPVCEHFNQCGGCKWQHLKYDRQMFWKTQNVKDSFERLGQVEYGAVYDCLPSEDVYHYRNKMEFTFCASRWLTKEEISNEDEIDDKNFALGLHVPGRFDKVVDINECHIHQDFGNKLLSLFREKAKEYDVSLYDFNTQQGFLRNLIIRYSRYNNEFMVNLITNDAKDVPDTEFMNWYKSNFPELFSEVTNVIHTVNNSRSPVPNNPPEIIYGPGFITEDILGIKFKISPFSFFQTNSGQLNKFIGKIIDTADLKNEDIIWDLYCGTGSITLPAAKKAGSVYGIELSEISIDDAKENARINNIDNVVFFAMDLHSAEVPELLNNLPKPDKIIIDPPRAGMHKNLIAHIIMANPKEIIYVSCNPATQSRDCKLMEEYYFVESIQPVDMFPHTYHIESIAKLVRKDGK